MQICIKSTHADLYKKKYADPYKMHADPYKRHADPYKSHAHLFNRHADPEPHFIHLLIRDLLPFMLSWFAFCMLKNVVNFLL